MAVQCEDAHAGQPSCCRHDERRFVGRSKLAPSLGAISQPYYSSGTPALRIPANQYSSASFTNSGTSEYRFARAIV